VVGILDDDGKFSLSDPISKYATSLRLPKRGELKATLEDILSHRVGVVPNAYDTRLEDGGDPAEIRRSLGSLNQVCPPGDCHTYQNVAFDAISEAVEAVTGADYAEIVTASLFEPLGMATASLTRKDLVAAPSWARPHRKRRSEAAPRERRVQQPYYKVPAAGGVNGSILDLAKFARAQMGLDQQVLPQSVLAEIHDPRVYTRREQSSISRRYPGSMRDARYALGWRSYKYADRRVVGHRGAVDGYRALILFDPVGDTGVVALWNSNSNRPVGVQFEVMDMAFDLPRRDWLKLDTEG
ncbi:MAG: serine hydrolase domain-containing protein, partial [Pseudomonadota bacterium]